ncbi:MAG: hypothetical protein VX519_11390, partial [Myxococcota bacterium]|nr:hypothetical protein [Myxococcota bacterium]
MKHFGATTHTGHKRKNNQDSISANERHGLYLVADGVGGRKGGERASSLTAQTFSTRAPALWHLMEHYKKDPGQAVRNQILEA